jgi:pimeloyl-ACP methyl ester carboxylesterase
MMPMTLRPASLLAATFLLLSHFPAHAADPVRVTPTDPSPLANTADVIERQFSPLEAYQLERKLRAMGMTNALDVNDLSAERLLVRAPDKPAPDGRYGLVIYLGSEKTALYDPEWNNVLDNHGVVFVSPDNAGDDTRALERRIPLALHAYEYARRTYNLDPARIYVAGNAGGSRLAERLAINYPDVFTGVVINSGAVVLGSQELPMPTADAMQRLRTQSRLMFATARWDQPAFSEQQQTLKSLAAYCIPVAHEFDNGHTVQGHAGITGRMLGDVFRELEAPRGATEVAPPGCEDTLQQTARAELERIRKLQTRGDQAGALKALVTFDHAYGRALFDEELALARELNPAFFDGPVGTAPARSQEGH